MAALRLQLFLLACCLEGMAAQGLVLVPSTMTRELGSYYLSKLGETSFAYYSIMYQRNAVPGTNVFSQLNNISQTDAPIQGIAKVSSVRGLYSKNVIGGKITVQSFYKILRCEDDTCFVVSRVVASELPQNSSGQTAHVLTHVKTSMGASGWLVNAPQSVVNELLVDSEEHTYVDEIYKDRLFYKVVSNPPPCSASVPQTLVGSIAEFQRLPGLVCVNYNGTFLLVGTTVAAMVTTIKALAVPWNQCDGSLGVLYSVDTSSGPRIFRLIKDPGNVPLSIVMDLPPSSGVCSRLYDTTRLTLQAVKIISAYSGFDRTVDYSLEPPLAILALGFTGSCNSTFFASGYGVQLTGQSEGLTDGVNNRTVVDAFAPYIGDGMCIMMLGVNRPAGYSVDFNEAQCAELFSGTPTQLNEGVITYLSLNPDEKPTSSDLASLQRQCADPANLRYTLDISTVLPQIALDFEEARSAFVSSAEVKLHLDAVATNAASVLATQVALASSGVVAAHLVGRSGYYRRMRMSSNLARSLACLITALAVTVLNIPNFFLIVRSLDNHQAVSYTRAPTVLDVQVSNYSAVARIETYGFVTIQGSSATAIIGLILYCVTLVLSVYATWREFTKIIKRRSDAASRLGHEAIIEDEDLIIQWRQADTLLHDSLYPKAVVGPGTAAEIELLRRALAKKAQEDSGGSSKNSDQVTLL